VPAYVALGLVVAHVPELLRRRRRLAVLIGSARHAFGPAIVLAIAGSTGPSWDDWPVYLAALAAQFAIDGGGFVLRDWLISGKRPRIDGTAIVSAWGVDAALAPIGFLAAVAATGGAERWLLVTPLLLLLASFARLRRVSIERALELGSAYRGTAFLLADVIEATDSYTGAHSRQVVELVLDVADDLGLSAEQRRQAELAALLHDVGKMWVPSALIAKEGALTAAERAVVNMHSIEGQRMLQRVGGELGEVGAIVRSCHERWDGSGYPDGLSGSEIPLIARIVACCDAYSAMTTDRPYHSAVSSRQALLELRAQAGTQFDPAVVASLVRVLTG
jgi:HD-GYP domain-containing protein (c-di-GMP phosphodiesterase class II)